MDFFSLRHGNSNEDFQNTKDFATAIQDRFGSNSLLTTRLTPVQELSQPVRNVTINPTTVTPATLHNWLNSDSTLILDIRTHAAYNHARIPDALPLSVPSTLLKRPLFSLQRLAAMLPSSTARSRFISYKSYPRILVYDADAHQIPENSNINGLLKKFANDGYEGELAWLKGGFQSVWREKKHLVDLRPPPPERSDDDEDEASGSGIDTASSNKTYHYYHHRHLGHLPVLGGGPIPAYPAPVLRASHLPMDAFSFSSTTRQNPNHPTSMRMALNSSPMTTGVAQPVPPTNSAGSADVTNRPAFNPFFDTIRQNIELQQGITERIPLRLPRHVRRRINDLPFDWLKQIAKRADVIIPQSLVTPMPRVGAFSAQRTPSQKMPSTHTKRMSPDLAESTSTASLSTSDESPSPPDPQLVEEGMEALAMQFYRIELAEQRRLMGVMEHHSKESSTFGVHRMGGDYQEIREGETEADVGAEEPPAFPFSITAGVEKGTKNRYRHIWPFEHARVRLHTAEEAPGEDSTTNADGTPAGPRAQSRDSDYSTNLVATLSAERLASTKPISRASIKSWNHEEKDDYVNASFVQPLGTNKRYIATQGPLDATFDDFWRLCWEQNVHVIVMLTKEVEGSMVKCGVYWADVGSASSPPLPDPVRKFGPLTLTFTSKVGYTTGMRAGKQKGINLMHQSKESLKRLNAITTDAITGGAGGGGFEFPILPAPATRHRYRSGRRRRTDKQRGRQKKYKVPGLEPSSTDGTSTTDVTSDSNASPGLSEDEEEIGIDCITTIKRTFELSHDHYPQVSPRKIIQLQYLEWPDMNVPDDPRGVLDLLERVDMAVQETGGSGEADTADLYSGLDIEESNSPFHDTRRKERKAGEDQNDRQTNEADLHAKGKSQSGERRWEKKGMVVDKNTGIAKHAMGSKFARPVLLHCSAGVGRTGGYIALDGILDGIKREMRRGEKGTAATTMSTSTNTSTPPRFESMDTSEPIRIPSSSLEPTSQTNSNSDDESSGRSVAMDMDNKPPESPMKGTEASGCTVPLTMSGAGHGVVHVPAVVVPQTREGSAASADHSASTGSGSSGGGNMSEDEASGGGNSTDVEASASAKGKSPEAVGEDLKEKKKSTKKSQKKMTAIAHGTGGEGIVPMVVMDNDLMDVDRGGSDESSAGGRSGVSGGSGSASGSGTSGEASGVSGNGGNGEGSGGSSRDGGRSSSLGSAVSVGVGSGPSGKAVNVGVGTAGKHHHHLHGGPLSLLTKKWAQNVHDSQLDNSSSASVGVLGIGGGNGNASDSGSSMPIEPVAAEPSSSSASLPPISASGLSSASSGSEPAKSHGHHSHRSSSPAKISATLAGVQLQHHLEHQQRQRRKMSMLRLRGGPHGHGAHGHGTSSAASMANSGVGSGENISAPSLSSASTFPSISESDDDVLMSGAGPGGSTTTSLPTTVSEGGSSDRSKGKGREVEPTTAKEEERELVDNEAVKAAGEVAARKLFGGPLTGERARTFSAPQAMEPPKPILAFPGFAKPAPSGQAPITGPGSMAARARLAMGKSPAKAFSLALPPAFNLTLPSGWAGVGPMTDRIPIAMKQPFSRVRPALAPTTPPQPSMTKATVFNSPSSPSTGRRETTTTTSDTKIQQPQPVKPSAMMFGNIKPKSVAAPGLFPFSGQPAIAEGTQVGRSDDTSEGPHLRHTRVDYKEPRALHVEDGSPVSLSKFEAPVWEVIQDMREQRMSLCQSLRQYVFVHAAIVEGALRLVDEEGESRAGLSEGEEEEEKEEGAGVLLQAPAELNPQQIEMSERQSSGYTEMDIDTANTATAPATIKKGKRGASPTELPKEGKKGEMLLSKRPSIKRKTESPSATD